MASIRQRKNISENELEFRDSAFPGAAGRLWDKSSGGFVTIPKTMPIICRILDEMSKNQPLSDTYRMLWAYTWNNNAFARLNKTSEMAFAAGFQGQRGERTLRDRLKKLEALGFIEIRAQASNPMGLVFIPNPHEVILRLRDAQENSDEAGRAKLPFMRDETYFAFLERALDINCKDVAEIRKRIAAEKEALAATTEKGGGQASGSGRTARAKRTGSTGKRKEKPAV